MPGLQVWAYDGVMPGILLVGPGGSIDGQPLQADSEGVPTTRADWDRRVRCGFRGSPTCHDREVAIKIILPQCANPPDFTRRFEADAHIDSRVDDVHNVPLYDDLKQRRGNPDDGGIDQARTTRPLCPDILMRLPCRMGFA